MFFIFLSPLIGLVWSSNKTNKRNDESGHYFLFPVMGCGGGVFNISTLNMMLACKNHKSPLASWGNSFLFLVH